MILRTGINNPLTLPDCVAWYDAADPSSISLSGSAVTQWNDKSGSGYHLTQATSGNRPALATNQLGNRPGLTFNGFNQWVGRANSDLGRNVDGVTMFTVLKTTNTALLQRHTVITTNSGTAQRLALSIGENAGGGTGVGATLGGRRLDADTFRGLGGSNTLTANVPFIQGGTFSYTGTIAVLRVNGATVATDSSWHGPGNSSDTVSAFFGVGAGTSAGGAPFTGSLGEVIIYHRALSNGERRAVEWYLSRKWSINVV